MKKLVTHNGGFHADDVFAYVILQLVLDKKGQSYTLIRTRDEDVIKSADIVFDVGNIYNPETHRYDHHQTGRAGSRENGIYYAAAGLVWKHFGRELCYSDRVWGDIDKYIISPIDAADNGQNIIAEFTFTDVGSGSVAGFVGAFEPIPPNDPTPENIYDAFVEISGIVKILINKYINSQNNLEQVYIQAYQVYQKTTDKSIIIFDKNISRPIITRISELAEPLFVIYPDMSGSMWKAEAIRKHPKTFESRLPFPDFWAGLRDKELQEVSGVTDALFAHPGQFLVGAKTMQGVRQMITKAFENYQS